MREVSSVSLAKEGFHRIGQFCGSGLEQWMFLFKDAEKHASAENWRTLKDTETGTHEVSLEDVQAFTEPKLEEFQRMASNLCNVCPGHDGPPQKSGGSRASAGS